MIAIVDYKAGNLTSVKLAFDALGVETVITHDPAVIAAADRVVFPGVGAAKKAMENLHELGLVEVVRTAATSGKPFLGICLGMQIAVIEFARNVLGYADANSGEFDELSAHKVIDFLPD